MTPERPKFKSCSCDPPLTQLPRIQLELIFQSSKVKMFSGELQDTDLRERFNVCGLMPSMCSMELLNCSYSVQRVGSKKSRARVFHVLLAHLHCWCGSSVCSCVQRCVRLCVQPCMCMAYRSEHCLITRRAFSHL